MRKDPVAAGFTNQTDVHGGVLSILSHFRLKILSVV